MKEQATNGQISSGPPELANFCTLCKNKVKNTNLAYHLTMCKKTPDLHRLQLKMGQLFQWLPQQFINYIISQHKSLNKDEERNNMRSDIR